MSRPIISHPSPVHFPFHRSDTSSSSNSRAKLKDRRRTRSRLSSQALPKDVCHWNLKHADILNIKYDGDFLPTPISVVKKLGECAELNPIQKKYLDMVKFYIQGEEFDFSIDFKMPYVGMDCFYRDTYKSIIDDMFRKLDTILWTNMYGNEEDVTIARQDNEIETMVRIKVREFLFVVMRMLEAVQEKIKQKVRIPEITYCELPRAFADLCLLKAWTGKENPSSIHDVMGVKQITSKPDFRLYKTGMSVLTPEYPSVMVSVLQIKRDSDMTHCESQVPSENSSLSSESSETEVPAKKRRISSESSTTDEQLPAIRNKLSSDVLGQHAGKLFLDLSEFPIKKEEELLTMPGMIIDGTKVYFTLLEIRIHHLQKLLYCRSKAQLNLEEEDKATIYYSEPLDMLVRNDREILLDSFMRLNNVF